MPVWQRVTKSPGLSSEVNLVFPNPKKMEEEMGFMELMMERFMKRQSPEQKRDMMAKMMPKMMEGMGGEDMMAMMSQMMPEMMKSMGGFKPETMHEMMPQMMENCLTPMSEEERRKMLSFCHTMLGEMEEKFLASAKK